MSKRRHIQEENLYSGAVIQALEQEYCSSCSAAVVSSCCLVSSHGLGARVMSRIYHGGRQAVYTATMAAMLANNMAVPAYAATTYVSTGTVSSAVVNSGDTQIVLSNGRTVSAILKGGTQLVSSGGKTYQTAVGPLEFSTQHSGIQRVYNSAVATDTSVYRGEQHIYSGGVASGARMFWGFGGASQVIHNGGLAVDNGIGIVQIISSGGSALSTTIQETGSQLIYDGGVANSTTVKPHGSQFIYSGGIASRTHLSSGAVQTVYTGGSADSTYVASGATQTVASGGVTTNDIIESGGEEDTSAGGSSYDLVLNGGTQVVASGGMAYHTIINSAGVQHISNDGYAFNTEINLGGSQVVSYGGIASGTVINSAGNQYISSGGIASDTVVSSAGWQNIHESGRAYNTVVENGGYLVINYTHGSAINPTIKSGGRLGVGGSAIGVIMESGAQITVNIEADNSSAYISGTNELGSSFWFSNGVAQNFVLNASEGVYSGGKMINTVVNSGGTQAIYNSGLASNTTLNKGGNQIIDYGGLAISTMVNSGAAQFIRNGGVASYTQVNSGGSQDIASGGSADNTYVCSGGIQTIADGGIVTNNTVESGGAEYVSSGGITYDVVVEAGGSQIVLFSGTTIRTSVNSGGRQHVSSGGLASDTVVNSGGWQAVYEGGLAKNTVVNAGGRQSIASTGVASGTVLNGSGSVTTSQFVYGSAFDNVVNSRGVQVVYSGGLASGTLVNQGGHLLVVSGGEAIDATVSGSAVIYSGGLASNLDIWNWMTVSSGAIAKDTTIENSAYQEIESGGIASNTVISSGGRLNVEEGGSAVNLVQKAYGSVYVAGAIAPENTAFISGTNPYGQDMSLSNGVASHFDINYITSIGSGGIIKDSILESNGSLTVSAGGSAIGLVQSVGGRLITPVISAGDTTFISGTNANGQTMSLSNGVASNLMLYKNTTQQVASGGITYSTVLTSARQYVSSGGVANNTVINSSGSQTVSSGGVANSTILNGYTDQYIHSSGIANNTVIAHVSAQQEVYAGGSAFNTYITAGELYVNSGAYVSGITATGGVVTMVQDQTLNGNISLANAAVNLGLYDNTKTLTMNNLSASNALFNMNVDLQNQTADQLKITDSYSGNSLLQLTNVASSAQETSVDGIKLVEFGSSAAVNGTFDLVGGQWDEGGYVYYLQQGKADGSGRDYYLRNTLVVTDTFKAMLNIPVMNAMIAQTGMNSLQRRLGDLRAMNNTQAHQGVWARSYYKDMTVEDLAKTDLKLFGGEAGYDWLFMAEEPTKLYAGVLIGFVDATSIKTKNSQGNYEKGDGQAPGVGVYATLINDDGWFVDIAARNFWSKLDMTNHTSFGTEMVYKPSRNVFAASAEAGKSFLNERSRDTFIRIEPKVEVSYMNAASSETEVSNSSSKLKYDSANYINAKAGVLLAYNAKMNNGLLIEPLIELAYRYEFDGKDTVSYGGAKAESDLGGGTVELNAGLNMQLTENLYWYGLGSYEASNKVSGWGVHAGIRYAFGDAILGKRDKRMSDPWSEQHKAYSQSQQQKERAAQKVQAALATQRDLQRRADQQAGEVSTLPDQMQQKKVQNYRFMKELEEKWKAENQQ